MQQFWYPFLAWLHWLNAALVLIALTIWVGLVFLEGRRAGMPWPLRAMCEQIPLSLTFFILGLAISTWTLVSVSGRWW